MKSTIAKAREAKRELLQALSGVSGIAGVGLGREPDGAYCVILNLSVSSDKLGKRVPDSVNGVHVVVRQVGRIAALRG